MSGMSRASPSGVLLRVTWRMTIVEIDVLPPLPKISPLRIPVSSAQRMTRRRCSGACAMRSRSSRRLITGRLVRRSRSMRRRPSGFAANEPFLDRPIAAGDEGHSSRD